MAAATKFVAFLMPATAAGSASYGRLATLTHNADQPPER
jgi:hypothetical protein